jgi:HSP20 family protein
VAKTSETSLPVTRAERGLSRPWFWDEPFGTVNKFAREMERRLEDFGVPRGLFFNVPKEVEEASWMPEAEFFEKDGRLVVRTDLPGLNKEDIKVEVTNERLVVHGERKREKEEKGERFVRSERSYGSFYRTFALPEGVNPETAKATFKNGVLEVTLAVPPVPETHTRKVEIEERPATVPTKAA